MIGKKIFEGINLTVAYQDDDKLIYPLREANFYIRETDIAVIEGVRDSGKSLMLKVIAGEHDFQKGEIVINDKNISNVLTEQDRKLWKLRQAFLIPDYYELIDDETVAMNIELPLILLNYSKRLCRRQMTLACEAFQMLEIRDVKANELTPELTFRVMCARALVADPRLILIDDPFTNMLRYFEIESQRHMIDEINFCIQVLKNLNRTLLITAREKSRYIYHNRLYRHLFSKLILT